MASSRIRVGVIGTSAWAAREHLPGLAARGDVEVRALCGRDRGRLDALAARYGVPRTFTDWRELVASGLDAVVIATPNALHHPQATAALDAGLHVICEKPLGLRLEEARDLVARADRQGRATLTFFTHRSVAAAVQARRIVESGVLGRILEARASYLTGSQLRPGKAHSWRMRRAESGTGALGDIGSHAIDLVRWWMGDFARVVAQWQVAVRDRPGGEVDADDATAFLAEMASGARVVVEASKLAAGRVNELRVELHGEEASLVFEVDAGNDPTWEGRLWMGHADRAGLEPVALPCELTAGLDGPDEPACRAEAYRRLTDPFFAAVARGGGPVTPGFREGAAVQAVLDAVARSAEEKRWVEVEGV
jgi:predicted dehydrogenase